MSRWVYTGLLACLVTGAVFAVDEAEPPRLKKKAKPAAAPAPEQKPAPEVKPPAPETKPAPARKTEPAPADLKGEAAPAVRDPDQDPREIAARVARKLEAARDRLAARDTGAATQQVQRDLLEDLDALVEQARRQQQQQQQAGGGSASSSSQAQRQARRQRSQSRAAARQPQPRTTEQPDEAAAAGQGNARKLAPEMNQIADLYKDIWGHLPATLRQEIDQYGRVEFMAKYNDLLRQYYATLAEKSRRREAAP